METPGDRAGGLRVLLELNSSDTRIGAVNDALDLAHYTRALGVRYFFCGVVDAALLPTLERLGVGVVPGRSRALSRRGALLFGASVLGWAARLRRLRPHVVHLNYAGWGPSLAGAARLVGIPVVGRAGGDYDPRNRANRWISAYVANCAPHAQPLLDSPLAGRVYIAGDLFRPERLREEAAPERPLPARSGRPRFLFLGQIVERKGLAVLLDAFARMGHAAELMVVGGDWSAPGLPEQLRAQVGRLGLGDRVVLENHRPDVAALLRQCDAFVLPSLSEARPRSIIEAMCLGRPVVSTDVGGIPTLVEDGVTGLLVPPGDVAALAAALDTVAASPELRRRLGDAGLARAAQQFQPERTAARYVALYSELRASGSLPRT